MIRVGVAVVEATTAVIAVRAVTALFTGAVMRTLMRRLMRSMMRILLIVMILCRVLM